MAILKATVRFKNKRGLYPVEKPREFAPRGQSDDDPLKLFH